MQDPTKPKKRLEQVRDTLRIKHYSYHTEQTYLEWIRRFILFHHKRHPKDMAEPEVEAFLSHLAIHKKRRRLHPKPSALCHFFLYCQVLQQPLCESFDAVRDRLSQYLWEYFEKVVASLLLNVIYRLDSAKFSFLRQMNLIARSLWN